MDFGLTLKDSDKKRIIDYIKENELDYNISDTDIFRFHIVSEDNYLFQIYNYNEQYILISTLSEKGDHTQSQKFKYSYFKNLQQVIEQLSYHDNSIHKCWWELLDGIGRPSSINICSIKEGYDDDWFKDFSKNEDWYHIEEDQYKCLIYEKEINVKITSPHDKYNEYPPFYMDKLHVEVHPISLKENNEFYLVKILINNEQILKEYINYRVRRKKGLKLFFENLFTNKNPYIKI